ncbi:hypothetical protein SAMN05660477_00402 [Soonwooa buanensis]|uniref:Uncharacterized protein n=1 Tax=Soonwooa buanensis TaxID=619805 RepID=A0A1T5CW73_9FLAO|nr:hypothetical protein [Soonwooa buanensis]SKB63617.1 hypothetical protein SAMN05660477_00402 [Soonwooa buanensis]
MKKLYLQLLELFSEITEIKYIDLNYGQLQEEKPPLSYPAVLINLSSQTIDDVQDVFQILSGQMELTVVYKMAGESNGNAPKETQEFALRYLDLSEKIYKKLQGFEANGFDSFTRNSIRDVTLRKGLKTAVMTFETSWREDTSSS